MFDHQTISMLAKETWTTIYMTLTSTTLAYALGLPMGIALVLTAADGLKPNVVIYKILDFIVNIVRSVPFIILLIMLMPFTKLIVGKSYGPAATVVPLTIAAAPFIARLVESSLLEVDKGGGESISDRGRNDRPCDDTGVFRDVRRGRRRRSRRCGDPLRLSPLSGGYHDGHGGTACCTGTGYAVYRNEDFQKDG